MTFFSSVLVSFEWDWFVPYALVYTALMLWFAYETAVVVYTAIHLPAASEENSLLPGITVIRPVYGADENSEKCFRSCLDQDYDGPVEYLFCLQRFDDPALPILYQLKDEYHARWQAMAASATPDDKKARSAAMKRMAVLVHPVRAGFNGKTSNMYTGEQHATQPIVVFQDSDLVLETPLFLRQTVTALRHHDVVYSPPRWVNAENLWARMYAFLWNLIMLTLHCTSTRFGKPMGLAGPTMILPRHILRQIGGVQAVGQINCEDMELGRLVMKHKYSIGLGPLVTSPVGFMSFDTMMNNFARGLTNGHHAGFGQQIAMLAYFFYLLVLAAIPFNVTSSRLTAMLIFLVLKQIMAIAFCYAVDGKPFKVHLGELLLGETLVFYVFFKTLISPTFRWGGQLWTMDLKTAKMTPIVSSTVQSEKSSEPSSPPPESPQSDSPTISSLSGAMGLLVSWCSGTLLSPAATTACVAAAACATRSGHRRRLSSVGHRTMCKMPTKAVKLRRSFNLDPSLVYRGRRAWSMSTCPQA